MPFSRRAILPLAASLVLALTPAFADGDKGRGKGNDKDRGRGHSEYSYRPVSRAEGYRTAERDSRHVPPGLAKKPGNMPPGQYKKIHGERINDLSRYRLPPLRRGESYVISDGRIYRVLSDTAVVVAALGIVSDWLR